MVNRADRPNPTNNVLDKGGKGAGMTGVCFWRAIPFSDEIWIAAPVERELDAQWLDFRNDAGPPPDMPWGYSVPGSATGRDIFPAGDPLHYTSYQATPRDWEIAMQTAANSGQYWPPALARVPPYVHGPE